jgi:hypothetical protein
MVWLLDLEWSMQLIREQIGCPRVALSQNVWEQFIAIPDGVRGQCEGCRMWDLLCFLHAAIRFPRHPRQIANHVRFRASVVNDNREFGEEMKDEDYRPTDFWLVAHAAVDGAGSPCLVVTLPHEDCLM